MYIIYRSTIIFVNLQILTKLFVRSTCIFVNLQIFTKLYLNRKN